MYEKFEETYPHYTFAGLVGLGIAVAGLFTLTLEKKQTRTRNKSGNH